MPRPEPDANSFRLTVHVSRTCRRHRSSRALPGWLVSLAVHVGLVILLVCGFDHAESRDESEASGELLTLIARIGTESTPEPPGRDTFTVLPANDELPAADSEAAAPEQPDSAPALDQESPAVNAPSASEMANSSEPMEIVAEAETIAEITEGPAVPLRLSQTPFVRRASASDWRTQLAALTPKRALGNGHGPYVEEGIESGRGTQSGQPEGASFFQISAQGKVFCYVIDCSSSMESDNAIGQARIELLASLERLDASRQFQILLYDVELHPLVRGRQNTFSATDAHRKLARLFLFSQQSGDGTLHKPALLSALRSTADVIFFLTDGATPELSARDLRDLKTINRQRKQIHVIEFGQGAKLETNWLDELARDHGGSYRYRDTSAD